ncbi:hypothetical protein [Methylobacterium currus]|uniref:hypothetical protein n=1 Tax=Methylobacterium currus TaxID=2051553 RepID=UPI000F509259|nr:hypothetical protein [Methylobacterium currus]
MLPISVDNNIFNSLFNWHPNDGRTSKENFLTEAFAHVIRSNAHCCSLWMQAIFSQDIDFDSVIINTRASHRLKGEKNTIYPDMEISGYHADGRKFGLLVENKWDSPASKSQIFKYGHLARQLYYSHLIFIAPNSLNQDIINEFNLNFPDIGFMVFTWKQIYNVLRNAADTQGLAPEFLGFMKTHNLSPADPIEADMVRGFIEGHGLANRMISLLERIRDNYDWKFIPSTHKNVKDCKITSSYGRIALEIGTPKWDGAITVGFLTDNWDHKVPFSNNRQRGLDLIFRIEANPKHRDSGLEIASFVRAAVIDSGHIGGIIRFIGDKDNRNTHTIVIAQRSLLDLIESKESGDDQAEKIYRQIEKWGQAIFASPEVVRIITSIGT